MFMTTPFSSGLPRLTSAVPLELIERVKRVSICARAIRRSASALSRSPATYPVSSFVSANRALPVTPVTQQLSNLGVRKLGGDGERFPDFGQTEGRVGEPKVDLVALLVHGGADEVVGVAEL
jgi:hypothetical protein